VVPLVTGTSQGHGSCGVRPAAGSWWRRKQIAAQPAAGRNLVNPSTFARGSERTAGDAEPGERRAHPHHRWRCTGPAVARRQQHRPPQGALCRWCRPSGAAAAACEVPCRTYPCVVLASPGSRAAPGARGTAGRATGGHPTRVTMCSMPPCCSACKRARNMHERRLKIL
jgi:hypothetical protein